MNYREPLRLIPADEISVIGSHPSFRTRYIPKKLLNFDVQMANDVRRNGLCDTLTSDSLKMLHDQGVEMVETRLTWWDMEPEPGRIDLSRIEREIELIKKTGMQAGLFPWFQHPPDWYKRETAHIRFRCLEHGTDSTIISIWDPKTLDVYDRLYSFLDRRIGKGLDFMYVGISGDYGEVVFPTGVKHYLFSPAHGHHGFWSGDVLARDSLRQKLQKKYGSLKKLNAAWNTHLVDWHDDLMPILPFEDNLFPRRFDFMEWYTGSLLDFTDKACRIFRHHFPEMPAALPIGCIGENLCLGNIKSKSAKIAARYNMTARWTGMGHLKSFPYSNIVARRIASAAHFYKTTFGEEAALILDKDNAANALYECHANGSSIIHDDPQNIERAIKAHSKLLPKIVIDPPQSSLAVFYPLETEMLKGRDKDILLFFERSASLRQFADYDICDSHMIRDGCLKNKRDLLFLTDTLIPHDIAFMSVKFAATGGRIWLYRETNIEIFGGKQTFETLAENANCKFFDSDKPKEKGVYHCNQWPKFKPYSHIRAQENSAETQYITIHGKHISRYFPDRHEIELLAKCK